MLQIIVSDAGVAHSKGTRSDLVVSGTFSPHPPTPRHQLLQSECWCGMLHRSGFNEPLKIDFIFGWCRGINLLLRTAKKECGSECPWENIHIYKFMEMLAGANRTAYRLFCLLFFLLSIPHWETSSAAWNLWQLSSFGTKWREAFWLTSFKHPLDIYCEMTHLISTTLTPTYYFRLLIPYVGKVQDKRVSAVSPWLLA